MSFKPTNAFLRELSLLLQESLKERYGYVSLFELVVEDNYFSLAVEVDEPDEGGPFG